MEIYFPLEINDLTIFEKYYRIKLFQLANRVFLKPYKDNINCKKFLKEFGKLISEIKEVWVSRYHFFLQSSKTDARGNTATRLKGMIPFAFCSTGGELLRIREVYTNRLSPSTKNPTSRILSLSSSRLLAIVALSRCTLTSNLILKFIRYRGDMLITSNFSNFSNLFNSFHAVKI